MDFFYLIYMKYITYVGQKYFKQFSFLNIFI